MKKLLALFFLVSLIVGNAYTQELPEKSLKIQVEEVTVFIDGAQLTGKATTELSKGKSLLKFTNLSPYIDAKSIRVKASNSVSVLAVNHQQNFVDRLQKPKELTDLEATLRTVAEGLKIENINLEINSEELKFMQDNRIIGGKNQETSVANFRETSSFYGTKISALKLKELEINKKIEELNKKQNELQNQLNTLTSQKQYPSGEVMVNVEASNDVTATFEVTFMVGNAGWFPSYDIRALSIDQPVVLVYKANIKQDSKTDWKNVKLKLSTSEPNVSGVPPTLKTYFLNYNTLPPTYSQQLGRVTGRVMDSERNPLPGVSVTVTGTTISTVTAADGSYYITLPASASYLTFSFVGYQSQTLPVNPIMNVVLSENNMMLDEEVVVTAYGITAEKRKLAAPSSKSADEATYMDEAGGVVGQQGIAQKPTAVDFEIREPYTVDSDNKNHTVEMVTYSLPAMYEYYSVPKIDRSAFLLARITDWEKYSLLDGEANIFFENTFVGATVLDISRATDTLQVSLGRDKGISINREKIKDYTTRQLVGTKKEETRTWRTTVKNNKLQKISITVMDQVPVSTSEEIEVNILETSGGKVNTENGEVTWELTLEPGAEKKLDLKYSVKYPKNKVLVIE